jgi:putative ATP-binding cassette transporter
MKPLGIGVALFGLLALAQPAIEFDISRGLLGVAALGCAVTTYRSAAISSYLKIFVWVFSAETIVSGLAVVAGRAGLWPTHYAGYLPPQAVPLATAIFSIAIYLAAHIEAVKHIVRIADRYFNAADPARAHVWPLSLIATLERRIAVALVVALVLITQAEVGVLVRLSYFTSDIFDAIQTKDSAGFWGQLVFVFAPWPPPTSCSRSSIFSCTRCLRFAGGVG